MAPPEHPYSKEVVDHFMSQKNKFFITEKDRLMKVLNSDETHSILVRTDLAGCVHYIRHKIKEGGFFNLDEIVSKCKDRKGRKASAEDDFDVSDVSKISIIQEMISRSIYPLEGGGGDSASSSKTDRLSHLLLARAKFLIMKVVTVDFSGTLRDLDLAESWGGLIEPSDLTDLSYLKGVCQTKLKMFDEAMESMKRSGEHLENSGFAESKISARKAKVTNAMNTIHKMRDRVVVVASIPRNPPQPTLPSYNPIYPSLSNAAGVRVISGKGRGVVAQKDIVPGEIVCVEDAVSKCPLLAQRNVPLTHCHHCLVFTHNLLPCPDCSEVLFCSAECRDEALGSYHRYECDIGLFQLLKKLHLDYSFDHPVFVAIACPLRLLLAKPISEHAAKEKEMRLLKPVDYGRRPTADNPYLADDWRNFWNLEDNFTCGSHVSVIMPDVAVAMELAKAAGYFPSGKDSLKHELLATKILIQSTFIFLANRINVHEPAAGNRICQLSEPLPAYSIHEISSCIFNTRSLFNSSCVPNVNSLNVGGKEVLVTVKFVKRGEELCLKFNLTIKDLLADRQLLSSGKNYKCDCLGCVHKWEPRPGDPSIERWRFKAMGKGVLGGMRELEIKMLKAKNLDKMVEELFVQQAEALSNMPRKTIEDQRTFEMGTVSLVEYYQSIMEMRYTMTIL